MFKLNRGCKKELTKRSIDDLKLGFECHSVRHGGKKRGKASLSTAELKALSKMVIDEGVKPRDAALIFNVKPRMVWTLVYQVKLVKHSHESIREKQEMRKLNCK